MTVVEIVPAYSAAQVRAAEAPLLERGEPLMARAAGGLALVVREAIAPGSRVLVLAGSGNNGGDALYAAAELANTAEVDVLTASERAHAGGLAAALAAGSRRTGVDAAAEADYDLILDGLLGIGASGSAGLRGSARAVVDALSASGTIRRAHRIVAADLPSGMDADTGRTDASVVHADITVTFGAVKRGLALKREPVGELMLVRIGLDTPLAGVKAAGSASVSRIVEAR